MIDALDRFGRVLLHGSIAIAALTWVLVDEAISQLFLDTDVPADSVAIEQVQWSLAMGPDHEASVPLEVTFRNLSGLRLRRIAVAYRFEECAGRYDGARSCSPVAEFHKTEDVDVAARLRGRYDAFLRIPALARPEGSLRLSVSFLKATGQADDSLEQSGHDRY